MAIKERFTIEFLNGLYWLKDEGFTEGSYATEELAKAEMRKLVIQDGVSDFIEDAILDLKLELVQKFGITQEEAHNLIREAL